MTVNQRQYGMFYRVSISIICGIFYALSFPPFDLWFLIFPSLFLFYIVLLQNKSPFLSGFLFATIAYGIVLYGIKSIGYEAWIPLIFFMGLMYGVFGRLFQYVSQKTNNNIFILLSIVSAFDLLRAYFPFGGFPWGYPSTVLISGLTKNLFRYFGPIGFSLIIQTLVLLVVLFVIERRIRERTGMFNVKFYLVFLFIIGIQFLWSDNNEGSDFQDMSNGDIEVSIVQGNSPCPGAKNRCINERERIYQSHLNLTRALDSDPLLLKEDGLRLIIWPESSTGFNNDPLIHVKTLNEISTEVDRLDAYFLIGGDRPIDSDYFENYGVLVNTDGNVEGQYLKQHPVPFGEYIPFRKYLEWIPPLALVPRDMNRGEGQEVFTVRGDLNSKEVKISPVISFEGSFERYIRRSVQEGAELIVILTNQASYGESGMSDQFILMSRANAVSNHRDIVHAAITGKSAFISGVDGKIYSSTELFEADTSTELLKAYKEETPYSRYGNYLNYVAILFGAILFLYFRFVKRQSLYGSSL